MDHLAEYITKENSNFGFDEGMRPNGAHHNPWEHGAPAFMSVRAVEFIAKPGTASEVRASLRGRVFELLRKRGGFAGALVLASHKEPRLVLVLSFWNSEKEATETRWEDSRRIRQVITPLIDRCSHVHTYEAAIPASAKSMRSPAELIAC